MMGFKITEIVWNNVDISQFCDPTNNNDHMSLPIDLLL